MSTFHLSIKVNHLEKVVDYYTTILGCSIGMEGHNWKDILFFGHQVTVHQASENQEVYPVDHFGVIIKKEEWDNLIIKLRTLGVDFLLEPTYSDDQRFGKFLIQDPADNILEIKCNET